jgi:pimeloyl-ACP methyl ester carboxylesterase
VGAVGEDVAVTRLIGGASMAQDELTHQYEDVNGVRLHYVVAGTGDPVVLLHGWPQTWYEWRRVMPELATRYTVIAPDLRGLGESSVPASGYGSKTVAEDLHLLCTQLGHERVAVVGHDLGMGVAYAWAASYPDEVRKLAVAESLLAGVGEPPAASRSGEPLWHPAFHMVPGLAEQLVQGRERAYFSYFFRTFAHRPDAVPDEDLEAAVEAYSRPGRLTAGFSHYRAMPESAGQNAELMTTRLTVPVLAVGGEACFGDIVGQQMELVAEDVTTVTLKECGHWVTAEQPSAFLRELLAFLAA